MNNDCNFDTELHDTRDHMSLNAQL